MNSSLLANKLISGKSKGGLTPLGRSASNVTSAVSSSLALSSDKEKEASRTAVNHPQANVPSVANMMETKEFTAYGDIVLKHNVKETVEIFQSKFSLNDEFIVTGLGDGRVQVYLATTGELVRTLHEPHFSKTPVTGISFRPVSGSGQQNVAVISYADGKVRHWHVTSGEKLSELDESNFQRGTCTVAPVVTHSEENQVLTVQYCRDGTKFVTSGSDCTVRIYDEATRKCVNVMSAGNQTSNTAGHSNRIFCAKFHPKDPNLLATSGWDNTVQMWDSRVKASVRSIYGPHICGESIDFDDSGDRLVTGAYDKKNPLQIWSYADCSLIETVAWSVIGDRKPCLLYSAAFSHESPDSKAPASGPPNKYIIAGGDIGNEMKITGMQNAVYTTAMSYAHDKVVVAGGNKTMLVFDHKQTEDARDIVY